MSVSVPIAGAEQEQGERALLLPCVAGFVITIGAIAEVHELPGYAAIVGIAGLALHAFGLSRIKTWADSAGAAGSTAYFHFMAITIDVASILAFIAALGVFGVVQSSSACMAGAMYLVVLLCSLIKSNAMKKPAYMKVMRVGRSARWIIGAVLALSFAPHPELSRSYMPFLELSDFLVMMSAATTLAVCVFRSARFGLLLSLRDPAPTPVVITAL